MLTINTTVSSEIHGLAGRRVSAALCDSIGELRTQAKTHKSQLASQFSMWGNGSHGIGSLHTAMNKLEHGDMARVALADEYLSRFESHTFTTKAFETIDSVVGACPNVPAYIAGDPFNMRLRRRTTNESAPLAIFVDLTSSAAIKSSDLEQRGAAILALVRALSNKRPIELWAGCGLDMGQGASLVYFKIDTAPLDLAHAAYVLGDTAVSRGICYGISHALNNSGGSWPFQDHSKWRDHGHTILQSIIPHNSEVLFLAPMINSDDSIKAPDKWLNRMLLRYGGDTIDKR